MSAAGVTLAGAAGVFLNVDKLFHSNIDQTIPLDAKKVFSKCGTCSRTFFTLLNREFGSPKITEELASDPLAGGLLNTQNQCGMLWGSALAVGAESYRRYKNQNQAMAMAIIGSQHIMESFIKRTKSANCRDVIGVDISNKIDVAGFMLKSLPGGFSNMLCMNLAEKWAPEAIQTAKKTLSGDLSDIPLQPWSCASEVAKLMGAGKEETVTVAGFAGGIGLTGNGCGALGAAIWLDTLKWCRKNPGQSGYNNPNAGKILNAFNKATGLETLCSRISGQNFRSITDHAAFLKNGGCKNLIITLANQA